MSEALPLSLIEAIASGIPVVATAVGGVPSIIRNTDGGWMCEPNDPAAMQAAMEQAIFAPNRREIASRARQLTSELYSADRMAADYQALYTQLSTR
jgi:glycosyltransferase involved in cell wall biosynthesis